jgi:methoxymalonate biosynthesis acyl carrier protein
MTASDVGAADQTLLEFLQERTKQQLSVDTDVFAEGLVSSLFALELVVFVERTFSVRIAGPDLTLANFRTVRAMTALVDRLRS